MGGNIYLATAMLQYFFCSAILFSFAVLSSLHVKSIIRLAIWRVWTVQSVDYSVFGINMSELDNVFPTKAYHKFQSLAVHELPWLEFEEWQRASIIFF
jgi:hypothetical protein